LGTGPAPGPRWESKMNGPTNNKDLNRAIRDLLRSGWTDETGKKHVKLKSPVGRTVVIGRTPSDHRTVQNVMADIRRAMVQIEDPKKESLWLTLANPITS